MSSPNSADRMLAIATVAILLLSGYSLLLFDTSDSNATDATDTFSGSCGDNLKWTYNPETGLLKITGYGPMTDYSWGETRWGDNIIKAVSLPNGLTSIGSFAFYDCTSLKSLIIPDTVETVGQYSFFWCTSLGSVVIGTSVCLIDIYAFYGCSSLTTLINNSVLRPIAGSESDGYVAANVIDEFTNGHKDVLIGDYYVDYEDANKTLRINRYVGTDSSIVLDTITIDNQEYRVVEVASNAFSNRSSLESIVIGNSVRSIGASAFEHCNSLREVSLPDSITTLSVGMFKWCYSLPIITIPDSIQIIGPEVFIECGSLTSITIPNSVKCLGKSCFARCESLTSITIPDSVKNLGASCFYECKSLESVKLSDSISNIDEYTFYGCKSLWTITIPESIETIGDEAFGNCDQLSEIVNLSGLNITVGAQDNGKISYYARNVVNDPNDATLRVTDGKYLCVEGNGSVYLLKYVGNELAVTLPDSIRGADNYYVCKYAFTDCSARSITFNESLLPYIDEHAFYNTGSLDSLSMQTQYGISSIWTSNSGSNRIGIATTTGNYSFNLGEKHGFPSYQPPDNYNTVIYVENGTMLLPEPIILYLPECSADVTTAFEDSVYIPGADIAYFKIKHGGPLFNVTYPEGISQSVRDNKSVLLYQFSNGMVIAFDRTSVSSLFSEDCSLEAKQIDKSNLTAKMKMILGDNPVYNISFGNNKDFGDGKVTICIPYELAEGKVTDQLSICCFEDGKIKEEIPCTYEDGIVTFTTNHLSEYAIVYGVPGTDKGDEINPIIFGWIGAGVGVLALLAIGVLLLKRRA